MEPEKNQKILNYEEYGRKLQDPRWSAKRHLIMERDKNRCINCGSVSGLQVHHRQYHKSDILNTFRNPWDYDSKYLITLCDECHHKGHKLYKVPVKYIN